MSVEPANDADRPARERRRSAATHLVAQIAGLIEADELGPGTHLRTQVLADRFEVSRWPVLQALRTLAQSGRVEYRKRHGFFVGAMRMTAEPLPADGGSAAYFDIAADLLAGRIGHQVSESFLRERYRLTRGGASELLARIAHEGWAERRAGYGWTFTDVLTTPEALERTYRFRLIIEPAALLQPGYRLGQDTIDRLRRVERELLDGALERLPANALYDKTIEFHESLMAGAQNPFLLDALRRVNRVRRLLTYRSMDDRRRYYRQSEEHLHLLDLLQEGRQEEASAAMRAHLEGVMVRFCGAGASVGGASFEPPPEGGSSG